MYSYLQNSQLISALVKNSIKLIRKIFSKLGKYINICGIDSLSKLKLNPAICCSPVDLFYVLTNWLNIIGRLNRIIIKTIEIKIIGKNIIVLFKNMTY